MSLKNQKLDLVMVSKNHFPKSKNSLKSELEDYLKQFTDKCNPLERYCSYDYCYNYFRNFKNKDSLKSNENIEVSCLHLWTYLTSWGMIRGSSKILSKSFKILEPVIECIANADIKIWELDVSDYMKEGSIKLLKNTYNEIDKSLNVENKNKLILITKIMLGVFGCIPAFDENFKAGMGHYSNEIGDSSRYYSFNPKSIKSIYNFYDKNWEFIDEKKKYLRTINYNDTSTKLYNYKQAKIIDMIAFCKGIEINDRKKKRQLEKINKQKFSE